MRSFRQFVNEVFYTGTPRGFRYSEVYKNPTASELQVVGDKIGKYQIPDEAIKIAGDSPCIYAGALIGPRIVFAFNRDNIAHDIVRGEIEAYAEEKRRRIDLEELAASIEAYLYYFPRLDLLCVSPSTFTHGDFTSQERARIQQHPAFKRFDVRVLDGG